MLLEGRVICCRNQCRGPGSLRDPVQTQLFAVAATAWRPGGVIWTRFPQ